mmetsp:Transcript_56849/g.66463  ORF Transcript_56849/g.66463 Transcript_56849/m.66463 type:complete len:122 (-) Transcript_56849:112-477(-)
MGKEYSSGHWCIICRLHPNVWKVFDHTRGEKWTMKSLRAMAESTKTNAERLGVKIKPYLDFIPMSNFVIPVLHSQINLGNDVLYSLLDYAADNIESISSEEQVTRNSYLYFRRSNRATVAT